jgi:hypothetical protein
MKPDLKKKVIVHHGKIWEYGNMIQVLLTASPETNSNRSSRSS